MARRSKDHKNESQHWFKRIILKIFCITIDETDREAETPPQYTFLSSNGSIQSDWV